MLKSRFQWNARISTGNVCVSLEIHETADFHSNLLIASAHLSMEF